MCMDDDCTHAVSRRGFIGAAAQRVAFLGILPRILRQMRGIRPFMAEALADPSVLHGPTTFPGEDRAAIRAHIARPNRAGQFLPLLINHGNPGLPEDIRASAAYAARWGYVALALDSDSRGGDGSGRLNKSIDYYRSDAFAKQQLDDNDAALTFLSSQRFLKKGRPTMLGFCGGGYLALRYAAERRDVGPVVALYASPTFPGDRNSSTDPRPELLSFLQKVRVPFQAHYGTRDPLIPAEGVQRVREIIERVHLDGEVFIYPGADHAFCDYTRPELYDEASAKKAMERAQTFLDAHRTAS
jgi:carboxymethylenebutenolidase